MRHGEPAVAPVELKGLSKIPLFASGKVAPFTNAVLKYPLVSGVRDVSKSPFVLMDSFICQTPA